MSADVTPQPTTTDAKPRRPRLWHWPADRDQRERALAGTTWVARCGCRVRSQAGTKPRKPGLVEPIQRCVVCVEMQGATR